MDDHELPEGFTNEDAEERRPFGPGESELESALGRRMQECIEKGTFPLEVQFALDFFADGDRLRCRTRVLPSDPPSSLRPVLVVEGVYKFRFDQFQQAVIDRIRKDVGERQAGLYSMVSLARIDGDSFCELAPEYFVDRLESPENELPEAEHLPLFVLFIHDVDPELLPQLVTRTKAISRRAAVRLRNMLLDAMDEPQCAEELGWLAAQTLRDRLEEA